MKPPSRSDSHQHTTQSRLQSGKLTEKDYWESVHSNEQSGRATSSHLREKLKALAKTLLGLRALRYYSDYLLWDVIFPRHLPAKTDLKVLEIGSAPGDNLVRLRDRFGFVPYGVEYSENGVELNRKTFVEHRIDPDNVIHADFFSSEFQATYKEQFDIVLSAGFIEHFTDPKDAVAKHINLLSRGGHLVVAIPNIRGVNYLLSWIFHKETLDMHNLKIMCKTEFQRLFDPSQVEMKFCDYCGTFDFGIFNTKPRSPLRFLLYFCKMLQALLNAVFPLLFRDKGAETSFFSPYLLYIGVKKQ